VVVEGRGEFPFDMLRYDSAFPYREEDSSKLKSSLSLDMRRVVLCRRGVNASSSTAARWSSFGWQVVMESTDPGEAINVVREIDTMAVSS
jgi:hypothetical protein